MWFGHSVLHAKLKMITYLNIHLNKFTTYSNTMFEKVLIDKEIGNRVKGKQKRINMYVQSLMA
jgi:hypothetical protein